MNAAFGIVGQMPPPSMAAGPSSRSSISGSGSRSSAVDRHLPKDIIEEEEAAKRATMRPSTSGTSGKGVATMHLTSPVVLVSPLGPGEDTSGPRADTVLDGTLEVQMEKPRIAKSIRVSLVCMCRLQQPQTEEWQEKIIFERSVEIGGEGEEGGIRLERGTQTFGWSIILPATIAVYDKHPTARISHVLRAVVEGEAQPTTTFSIFGGIGKGKGRSSSRANSPGGRSKSRPGSRAPSPPPAHTSRSKSRPSSRAPSPHRSPRHSLVPVGGSEPDLGQLIVEAAADRVGRSRTPQPPGTPPLIHPGDIKPLRGNLVAERHIVVAANPSSIEHLRNYSFNKTGTLAGVGEWKWSLQSDALTVGSYINAKLAFLSPRRGATIFAVRLLLAQSYSVTDLFDPDAQPQPCPKRNFVITTEGAIPHEKRPGRDVAALWRAPPSTSSTAENEFLPDFKLKIGMRRLPDDTKARPSTMDGTRTPVQVSHEFTLQVFFAVDGTDMSGKPTGEDGPGVMRMMMVTTPVVLPSCCCTTERIDLPECEFHASAGLWA